MIKGLVEQRVGRAQDQRYGDQYNFGATYYDARDEAIRRGDRTIGTEHLLLALLVDPASPAARALACDLESARRALNMLDNDALLAVGVEPGITAGPITVRTQRRLRLTPSAKAILTGIPRAPKSRRAGLGKVLNSLLDLQRPDPAAELLEAMEVDSMKVGERFAELEGGAQK
jgi:hypothetical protein